MSEKDAYLAGLLEGEGGFMISRDPPDQRKRQTSVQYRAILNIGMTDREPVEFCSSAFGSSSISQHPLTSGKPIFYTKCKIGPMGPVLQRILPHLKSRRRKREIHLMLQMLSTFGPENPRHENLPISTLKLRNWLWEEMQRVKDGAV